MKKKFSKRGRKNRAAGRRFEAKVREDLTKQNWIVDKWTNNVDLKNKKIIPAKRKYNPYLKLLSIGTGFPDFLAFKKIKKNYQIIGIEVKKNGYLDKKEKQLCRWYLKNKIFSKILIAKMSKHEKDKRRTKIEYIDFEKKWGLF